MPQPIVPFVLAEDEILDCLPDYIAGLKLHKISINKKYHDLVLHKGQSQEQIISLSPFRFARILNLANGLAYGDGLGMPEWVMLDCALLPSFFAGFMGPAELLSINQRDAINEGLETSELGRLTPRIQLEAELDVPLGRLKAEEYIPLAEFCALARGPLKQVLAYSLYSLKGGLGISSKALGLALWRSLGYQAQMGVAQWSNLAAVRAHLRFGRLEIIDPLTPLHTKAGESFVYKIHIPIIEDLEQIIQQAFSTSKRSKPNTYLDTDQRLLYWQALDDLDWCLKQKTQIGHQIYVYGIRRQYSDNKVVEILIGH